MRTTTRSLLFLCLSSLGATSLSAQQSTYIRIEHPGARELAYAFEQEGFDVVEGSVRATSLELVAFDSTLAKLDERGVAYEVIDVGRPFAEIQRERQLQWMADTGEDMPPAGYLNRAQIEASMQTTAATFPSICQFVNVTQTYGAPQTVEGRDLFAVKISDNVTSDEDEPAFLLLVNAHAREIVVPVIALDAIDQLTSGYGVDPDITSIVDENEIWIIANANPDGYEYVFTTNTFWRKNRRNNGNGTFGVDLNRNFRFGWGSACGGSQNTGSETYRGPSAGSEPTTQAVELLSYDRNFAKVIDLHSSGRETLWEYACMTNPLADFLRNQAIQISNQASYGGSNRPQSANGEHYEWQLAEFSSYSFLIETATSFQPSYASAQNEAALVWPAIKWTLEKDITVSGNVTDACTGDPVVASVTYQELPYTNGEKNTSEDTYGRYHAWLPPGSWTLDFAAPGYVTQSVPVTVTELGSVSLDVQLQPVLGAAASATRNGSGANSLCYTTISPPVIGGSWTAQVDHSGHPGATSTAILVFAGPGSGIFFPGGEVLVNLASPRFFQSIVTSSGTSDTHSNAIPNDPCFGNLTVSSQAAILGGAGYELCNAEDLTSGM